MSRRFAWLLGAALLALNLAAGGAEPELSDWQRAVLYDDVATVRSLLAAGQDVGVATPSGKTALMAAVKTGDRELMALLMKAGAPVNASNGKGGTVLMYAMLSGDPAVARTVLDAGAEIGPVTTTGWDALMIATAKNFADLAQLLLAHGADANRQDIYGWTPLMRAAHEGYEQTLGVLLAVRGLDLALVDERGRTALHHAAFSGRADVVRSLLDAGADPQVRDGDGRRPSELAKAVGFPQLASLLETAKL